MNPLIIFFISGVAVGLLFYILKLYDEHRSNKKEERLH